MKRTWVPLVVLLAAALGSMAVINLRGVFGSDEIFSRTGSGSGVIESINTKHVTYEVFGAADAVGDVSYLDVDTQAQGAHFDGLPWTYTMTTTNPVVVANVVAQGDTDGIGCRITVNGELKDEHFVAGHHAQVFCLVKAG